MNFFLGAMRTGLISAIPQAPAGNLAYYESGEKGQIILISIAFGSKKVYTISLVLYSILLNTKRVFRVNKFRNFLVLKTVYDS